MLNEISKFLKSIKFRYSIVILLLICLMFLVIFPSLNHSISESHWSIINQTIGAIEVYLGFSLKYYFDTKEKQDKDDDKI